MILPSQSGGETPQLGTYTIFENGTISSNNVVQVSGIKGTIQFTTSTSTSSGNRYWQIKKNGSTVGTVYANKSPRSLSFSAVASDKFVATKYDAGNTVGLYVYVTPSVN